MPDVPQRTEEGVPWLALLSPASFSLMDALSGWAQTLYHGQRIDSVSAEF